jgi:hypothetical protein
MLSFSTDVTVGGKSVRGSAEKAGEQLVATIAADLNEVVAHLSDEMRKALDGLYAELEAKHGSQWPAGGGSALMRRSGAGLRSIKDSIKVTSAPGEVTGVISTGSLTVHETGATITAKRQYLTIPLPAALDSRGVPLRAKARDWDSTFIAKTKKGNLIIFRKETGGKITPLYLLKNSVTIPARLGMGKAFEDMAGRFVTKMVADLEKKL